MATAQNRTTTIGKLLGSRLRALSAAYVNCVYAACHIFGRYKSSMANEVIRPKKNTHVNRNRNVFGKLKHE